MYIKILITMLLSLSSAYAQEIYNSTSLDFRYNALTSAETSYRSTSSEAKETKHELNNRYAFALGHKSVNYRSVGLEVKLSVENYGQEEGAKDLEHIYVYSNATYAYSEKFYSFLGINVGGYRGAENISGQLGMGYQFGVGHLISNKIDLYLGLFEFKNSNSQNLSAKNYFKLNAVQIGVGITIF